MTVSGFLEGQAGTGRTMSAGPSTGLGETTGAVYDFTFKSFSSMGKDKIYDEPIRQRNDLLQQRLKKDPWELGGNKEKYDAWKYDPQLGGAIRDLYTKNNADLDAVILKGRKDQPDLYKDIKTTTEIREEARKSVNISERHMQEVLLRNPSGLSKITGSVVGGMGGVMADPIQIASLAIGAGEVQAGLKGFQFARAIMKAAAVEGVINAGVEAAQQPFIKEWQNTLGRRYGFGDAAENVSMAFAGGAGLSALIRGGVRGLKGIGDWTGSVSSRVLDSIASNEKIPASVRDAAAFLSRQAHIDESAPPGSLKTGRDVKKFRDDAQRIAEDFEGYQAPRAASSEGESLTASSSKPSEKRPEGLSTQDLPSQTTGEPEPSSFTRTARTEPSNRKGLMILGDIDKSSGSMIYHTTKSVDNLLKKANEILPELNRLTTQLSEQIEGLNPYPGRVKTRESLSAKVKKKNRGAHTMPDIVGGRLVAETPEAISKAVDTLRNSTRIIEVDDKLANGTGYRAVHVIVASDKGMSVEIQIQPREIREVQDLAHEKYYKKWDQFDKTKATPEQMKAYIDDMEAQEKLFADAWAKWEERNNATSGGRADSLDDMKPSERLDNIPELPEGVDPQVSADRTAAAESDLKSIVDEIGEEKITLDDGRTLSVKEFADEVKGKRAIIDAMKTCRIA